MAIGEHRPTQLIIDQQAIQQNIHQEVARLDDHSELFMVVKANGYGHGAVQVAQAARQAGATGFCVAILDEALELRHAGFMEPILVLGVVSPEYAPLMAAQHISVTVAGPEWITAASQYLQVAKSVTPLAVHLALDTGMGRIGVQTPDELAAEVAQVQAADQITFEGIFTHFSTADEQDTTYFNTQVARWQEFMAVLPERPRYVHVSNSATSLWHAACNGNMIRFGVAGYGLNPSGGALEPPFELHPAMRLTSELVFVKRLLKGRSVSYGATYTAAQDEWVGTIPIGYADGYERRLQGFHVLVAGQACEIIGRVCMDQMMVRLPREYPRGTAVTLIGQDGDAQVSMQEMATYCGTIHYEIACGFTARLPRRYI